MRNRSQGGYAVVASISVVALCAISLSVLSLRTSYRQQSAARLSAATTETVSKDAALNANSSLDVMAQIRTAINSGQASASLGAGPQTSYQTTLSDSTSLRLDISDSGSVTSKSVTGTGAASGFSMPAWSPTSSPYAPITLPSSVVSVKNGVILGRVFTVTLSRSLGVTNNLDPNNPASTSSVQKRVRIFEFPDQTAVFGKNLRIDPGAAVTGSVIAQTLAMDPGVNVGGSATISKEINVGTGARVGGATFGAAVASRASAEFAKRLEAGVVTGAPVDPTTFSVVRGTDSAFLMELGDRATNSSNIPRVLLPVSSGSPTNWDLYCLPYYSCSLRVGARLNGPQTEATITITQHDTSTYPGRVTALNTSTFTCPVDGSVVNGFSIVNSTGGVNLLIDPITLAGVYGASAARAIYADLQRNAGSRFNMSVALSNAHDLTSLEGFSLVTPNTYIYAKRVNTQLPYVPMSILATSMKHGFFRTRPVTADGQHGFISPALTPNRLSLLSTASGNAAVPAGISYGDITASTRLPPVSLLNWLVLAD